MLLVVVHSGRRPTVDRIHTACCCTVAGQWLIEYILLACALKNATNVNPLLVAHDVIATQTVCTACQWPIPFYSRDPRGDGDGDRPPALRPVGVAPEPLPPPLLVRRSDAWEPWRPARWKLAATAVSITVCSDTVPN